MNEPKRDKSSCTLAHGKMAEIRREGAMRALVSCLLLCAVSSVGLAETTYFVSPAGADGNDGSVERPFATIHKAADVVKPGDTVIVKDGVYTAKEGGKHGLVVERSGTAEAPITFRSEHRWGAVLDGKGSRTPYGWTFGQNAAYIVVEGFEIKEFKWGGFWNDYAHHVTMRRNHIHHIGNVDSDINIEKAGMCGGWDGERARYLVYDGNVFHDIGRTGPAQKHRFHDHGIYTCGKHIVITNNLFYDCNCGWGIQVAGYKTVEDMVISNNIFAFGRPTGHIILWQPCHNITIQNNIFYKPTSANAINFLSKDLQGITIRNNLTFGCGLKDDDDKGVSKVVGNIVGKDPMFVDAAKRDFRLKPESPTVDAGIADLAPVADVDGKSRPQGKGVDIGPYER